MEQTRNIIGITLGDPAGVGPEITAKALADPELYARCKPLVIGDRAILERACRLAGCPQLQVHPVASPAEGLYRPGVIDLYDMHLLSCEDYEIGKVSAKAGDAAFLVAVVRHALTAFAVTGAGVGAGAGAGIVAICHDFSPGCFLRL